MAIDFKRYERRFARVCKHMNGEMSDPAMPRRFVKNNKRRNVRTKIYPCFVFRICSWIITNTNFVLIYTYDICILVKTGCPVFLVFPSFPSFSNCPLLFPSFFKIVLVFLVFQNKVENTHIIMIDSDIIHLSYGQNIKLICPIA